MNKKYVITMKQAMRGNTDAVLTLMHMYEEGNGVPRDLEAADYWAGVYNYLMRSSEQKNEWAPKGIKLSLAAAFVLTVIASI